MTRTHCSLSSVRTPAMAVPKLPFSRQTLSASLAQCVKKEDPTTARRVCRLLVIFGIFQQVRSLPSSANQYDSFDIVNNTGSANNNSGQITPTSTIDSEQKVFGWDLKLNDFLETDILRNIHLTPINKSAVKQGSNFIRSQIGSVSLANLPVQSSMSGNRDRRAAMPVEMTNIETDPKQEFIYWGESKSIIDLQAENTNFDMSLLSKQMEHVKGQLLHFNATEVSELPLGSEVSTKYAGWRRLSGLGQGRVKDKNFNIITYGIIKEGLDYDACFAYCRTKGAKIVSTDEELRMFYRSFNIKGLTSDYANVTATLEQPGFHLYYKNKIGPTYHLTPEEAERKTYRDYVYDDDIYEYQRYKYVKLDAEIKYENEKHRMANWAKYGHYFGNLDLSTNCVDHADNRLFKLENFVRRVIGRKEAFLKHQEMSPLKPLYIGALEKGDHNILRCRRVGYEAAASSQKVAKCACKATEIDTAPQTLLDEIHDSINELSVNTRNMSEKPSTRTKRIPVFPAIASAILPKLTTIIYNAARSQATKDLAIDSSVGIVKLFAKRIMTLLNKKSTVDKLTFNEAEPSRLSGRELYDIASTYPSMQYTTNDEKQVVQFMAPATEFDGGIATPVSSAEIASTLVTQAKRLLNYKKRLFNMIQTGKFAPLNEYENGEKVVSLSQTTAELVPSTGDPYHGRHVLTSLVMQKPKSEVIIKPLPVYRTESGDISFYKVTPECQHAIKAKTKHNCELRQGIYDNVEHIQIGASHLVIITDHYKEITVECNELPEHHINLGVFVTNITGSFVLKLDQTKIIRSGSDDDKECKANVLVNRSLKVASMSKTQREIHKVLDKWNLKSLLKYRIGLALAIVLSFTTMLTLTLYVMFKGYKLKRYNKLLKRLDVTKKLPEHEDLIREMNDGLKEVKGKTNNILNTMITSDRLNENVGNLARGKPNM